MAKIIYETSLRDLVFDLAKKETVYVPALTHPESAFSEYTFTKLKKNITPIFDYPTTNVPPKEFLLPAQDVLFSFDGQISKGKSEKQIIFGVSIEDLNGLSKLGEIFSKPVTDEHFKGIRSKTIIVGIDRFSPPHDIDFDLYLMKINHEIYAGFAKTKAGQEILKSHYFKNQKIVVPKVKRSADALLATPNLATIIEKSKNHPIWDELAETCFGCGICSYVCPLCYCFETEDIIDFGTESCPSGKRCRNWSSCMLAGFAKTNAKDFQPALRDRIYNWHYHKFVRMPKENGFPGCVDCNRCVIYCPAKINYRKTLMRLIADYKEKK
jgi:sulfhydrogenase subunit beta (sulfur reductase)